VIVEDRSTDSPVSDDEHTADVRETLRLVDGLESGTYHSTCACGRPIHLRLRITDALKAVLPRLKRWLFERTPAAAQDAPETSRFTFIEVDE